MKMFAILILQALILQGGDNIEILLNPTCMYALAVATVDKMFWRPRIQQVTVTLKCYLYKYSMLALVFHINLFEVPYYICL